MDVKTYVKILSLPAWGDEITHKVDCKLNRSLENFSCLGIGYIFKVDNFKHTLKLQLI